MLRVRGATVNSGFIAHTFGQGQYGYQSARYPGPAYRRPDILHRSIPAALTTKQRRRSRVPTSRRRNICGRTGIAAARVSSLRRNTMARHLVPQGRGIQAPAFYQGAAPSNITRHHHSNRPPIRRPHNPPHTNRRRNTINRRRCCRNCSRAVNGRRVMRRPVTATWRARWSIRSSIDRSLIIRPVSRLARSSSIRRTIFFIW